MGDWDRAAARIRSNAARLRRARKLSAGGVRDTGSRSHGRGRPRFHGDRVPRRPATARTRDREVPGVLRPDKDRFLRRTSMNDVPLRRTDGGTHPARKLVWYPQRMRYLLLLATAACGF